MTEQARVVVIGGGIVGCSILYGLAKLGWTDILLVEKRNLTSGSTWHAAGNVTHFGHFPSITRLYVNSIETYLKAQSESGQSIGFHDAGSIRLATVRSELEYYRQLEPLYEQLGVKYRVISNDEISDIHPLLNTDGVLGAAYTPNDGHVDSSGTTHALAKSARQLGAKIQIGCPVQCLEKLGNGKWCIHTESEKIHAEHVVVATSFWARELLNSLGLNIPVYAVEHHEIVTGEIPELKVLDFEVPTVRDPYVPANIRQEGSGLLVGIYESSPKPWAVDGIPEDFAEELLVPDTERLEPHLLKLIDRFPVFGEAGIKVVNNGPICYTPDGFPLLGPVHGFSGLWLATGFCIGVGTGGGSGEFLAHWIVNNAPFYDLPAVYPERFTNHLSKQDCLEKIVATYTMGYSLHD